MDIVTHSEPTIIQIGDLEIQRSEILNLRPAQDWIDKILSLTKLTSLTLHCNALRYLNS